MLAAAGLPSTRGVIALARKASVGRPPSGPSTRSAARSAAGGSSSRCEESRQPPLPAPDCRLQIAFVLRESGQDFFDIGHHIKHARVYCRADFVTKSA
jgi:hypothetical protein